jgi:PiT family inorganic phosphate transporter
MLLATVVFLIAVALAFDFINGFHDAANSIATVVSTRVLSPLWAVAWAAFFNFMAAAPVLWGRSSRSRPRWGRGSSTSRTSRRRGARSS